MASAVIFMRWDSYAGSGECSPFFAAQPLAYNSRQERLHELAPGDRLWLVSRCPEDRQYYFAAALHIAELRRNPAGSREEDAFGEFAIIADRSMSHDLGKRFPAEGLLRAFVFDTGRPLKYGASIGQSLQTLRRLTTCDDKALEAAFRPILQGQDTSPDSPFGLWSKCDRVFADYFLKNWQRQSRPLAFLLYDPPPILRAGAPIFIHSDKSLRLIGRFLESQYVAGHKFTAEPDERIEERERVWSTYRADTIDPPSKSDFDVFWSAQNGVRSLFVMDKLASLPRPVQFKTYGHALQWGYPKGVGYRYLSFSQSYLLLRMAGLSEELTQMCL